MQLRDEHSFFLPGRNGKGILLVHGLTGIPNEMKLVARVLNQSGYAIYAPLIAGHGVDKQTLIATTWQDWLNSVKEAANDFSGYVDELYAAGICVGGKLAMLTAHQLPNRIKAAAIYSPCFQYDGWNVPWYYRLAAGLSWVVKIPGLHGLAYPESPSLGIKDSRRRHFMQNAAAEGVLDEFPAVSLVEMYRLAKMLKQTLPDMRIPTLVLHAKEDDLSHPKNARIIVHRMKLLAQLHWIENSYHMIHVDSQYHQVASFTRDFFDRQSTGGIIHH